MEGRCDFIIQFTQGLPDWGAPPPAAASFPLIHPPLKSTYFWDWVIGRVAQRKRASLAWKRPRVQISARPPLTEKGVPQGAVITNFLLWSGPRRAAFLAAFRRQLLLPPLRVGFRPSSKPGSHASWVSPTCSPYMTHSDESVLGSSSRLRWSSVGLTVDWGHSGLDNNGLRRVFWGGKSPLIVRPIGQ